VFRFLRAPAGRLPTDWVAGQVSRLDRYDGDIDALVSRIAHIRTWTYISHRGHWLVDAGHWQEHSRAIEDRLSDALHERLTQRFVDRRSALLARSLAGGGALLSAVSREGEVLVEGQPVGRIDGFRFVPDAEAHGEDGRALMSAARRALRDEIESRVRRLEAEAATAAPPGLALTADGVISWHGAPAAKLVPGSQLLTPAIQPLHDELLDTGQRERIRATLEPWLATVIAGPLRPLVQLAAAELPGAARGLAFQLVEGLGDLPRAAVADLVRSLSSEGRRALTQLGVQIGPARLTLPALLKPAAVAMRALVYGVRHGLTLPAPLPPPARISLVPNPALTPAFYSAIGFPVIGPRAIRTDMLNRFESAMAVLGDGTPPAALIACPTADVPAVLAALGWRQVVGADGNQRWRARPVKPRRGPVTDAEPDHPFAKLRGLGVAR
jgi:ATP-dependent RNA helicase SUPV3L1/SUV3